MDTTAALQDGGGSGWSPGGTTGGLTRSQPTPKDHREDLLAERIRKGDLPGPTALDGLGTRDHLRGRARRFASAARSQEDGQQEEAKEEGAPPSCGTSPPTRPEIRMGNGDLLQLADEILDLIDRSARPLGPVEPALTPVDSVAGRLS